MPENTLPPEFSQLCGWVPNRAEQEKFIEINNFVWEDDVPHLYGSAQEVKDAFCWEAEEAILGKLLPAHAQKIGSCVSHGWGRGAQDLMLCEIFFGKESESWPGQVATEPIYAGSRVEIGRGRVGNGDGSLGSWAADWVSKYGIIIRGKYGQWDLSVNDETIAKRWGAPGAGVPDELEPVAKEHPIKTVALVTTAQGAADALANYYPVPVCSNQGFSMTRDANGICRAEGSWAHCMEFRGVCTLKGGKRILIIQQSWGESPTGPNVLKLESGKEVTMPQGCFGCEMEVADKMLKGRDSYAISGFVGFKKRRKHEDWWPKQA